MLTLLRGKRTGGSRRARVCLIRPPSVVTRFGLTLNATPPISLAYLAASLAAAGHEAQVIDAVGEALTRVAPGFRDDVLVNGLDPAEVVARVDPASDLIGV